MLRNIFEKIEAHEKLIPAELEYLLGLEDESDINALFECAYKVKLDNVGNNVYFRGIVEFSNICSKDCFYCGIRKSNTNVKRFKIPAEDIINAAQWAFENGYGSIVLQSGEIESSANTNFVTDVLEKIRAKTGGKLGITLSLGEQEPEVYKRWFSAGAHRYLLRIETSNEELYGDLHPQGHSFERRVGCLRNLKSLGYQVGTGVMCGLPGQTLKHLVEDILFFESEDIDMIGMGPYIVHNDTPLAERCKDYDGYKQLMLGLKMIAVVRIYLRDVNIAATTALQALNPEGRELGLRAGANIIMPNITDTKYRADYQLYNNKPCISENSAMCKGCLGRRVASVGETIGYNEWGDSPHFFKRTENK
jgi:biotin synthase